ncbi:YusW family protein [Alkalicoccus chagannorensis]|uniref:YusW family protein n=1 Tax=Alkalicoccus chagannorensis TaxID=427072 RepID=UPI0004259FC6|nr:YusW family protein [Alkalicoccus chagannorensis]
MKKVITGLTVVTLLAACGGLEQVDPEENTETSTAADTTNEDVNENANETDEEETNEEPAEENNEDPANEGEETNDTASDDADAGSVDDVHEFDLHIEFTDDTEWEFEFERDDLEDMEIDKAGETTTGEAAQAEIEEMLAGVSITTERPLEDIITDVLEAAEAPLDDVEDVDIEIQYTSGEEIVIDHEGRHQDSGGDIQEFDLDIDFFSGDDLEFEYEGSEAEIERRDGSEVEGSSAVEEIEALLENISITTDRTISDMKQEITEALDLDPDDIEDIDVDVEYSGGQTVKWKYDKE